MQYLYEHDVGQLVRMARRHFARINQDKTLPQLEEFYLDNFIAPQAPSKKLARRFPRREVSRYPPKISRFATPKQIPNAAPCGLFSFGVTCNEFPLTPQPCRNTIRNVLLSGKKTWAQ